MKLPRPIQIDVTEETYQIPGFQVRHLASYQERDRIEFLLLEGAGEGTTFRCPRLPFTLEIRHAEGTERVEICGVGTILRTVTYSLCDLHGESAGDVFWVTDNTPNGFRLHAGRLHSSAHARFRDRTYHSGTNTLSYEYAHDGEEPTGDNLSIIAAHPGNPGSQYTLQIKYEGGTYNITMEQPMGLTKP